MTTLLRNNRHKVTKSQSPAAGVPPRPPLTEIEDRRACDSDRRVTVNNIQVILVYGRPGDRARWSVMTTGRLEPIKETGEETGEEKTEAPKEKCVVC